MISVSVCVCVRVGSLHPSVINAWRHVQLQTRRMRFGTGQLSEGGSHAVDTVNLEETEYIMQEGGK